MDKINAEVCNTTIQDLQAKLALAYVEVDKLKRLCNLLTKCVAGLVSLLIFMAVIAFTFGHDALFSRTVDLCQDEIILHTLNTK